MLSRTKLPMNESCLFSISQDIVKIDICRYKRLYHLVSSMMTEPNNSSEEFDIFELLNQHNKGKKKLSTIEHYLNEIKTNLIEDMKRLKINLSSTELKQNVVRRIQEKIKYLENRYTYWRNAKKAWACLIVVILLLAIFWSFGKQAIELLVNLVGLSKNQESINVDIPEEILFFLGLLTVIISSKFTDIIAEGIWFVFDGDSVRVLKGLEECISFLEIQEDINWTLKETLQK